MDLNEVIRMAKVPTAGTLIETVCHVVQKQESAHQQKHSADTQPVRTIEIGKNSVDHETSNPRSNPQINCRETTSSSTVVQGPEFSNVKSFAQESQKISTSVRTSEARSDVVVGKSTFEDPSGSSSRVAEPRSLYHGGAGQDDHRLRKYPQGPHLPTHVGNGAGLGSMVLPALLQVNQAEPSSGAQVYRDADRAGRNLESSSACVQHRGQAQEHGQAQGTTGQGKESTDFQLQAGHDGSNGVRHATGMGTGATSRWRDHDDPSSRCPDLARSHGQHGRTASTSVGTSAAEGSRDSSSEAVGTQSVSDSSWMSLLAAGDVDGDDCFHTTVSGNPSPDRRRFTQALRQIEAEYQSICAKSSRSFVKSKKSATLFEVFCSNRSRLTHQVNSLGGKANRYFKDQTDLMTPEGRAVLFQDLLEQEPEHVWYAPECGPWSAWSNLNQAKSIEGWLQVQSRRWDNIDQLALGVVLLRHQRARGHHFHWEQPGRSNMFQTPILIPRLLPPSLICATWDICVTLRMVSL